MAAAGLVGQCCEQFFERSPQGFAARERFEIHGGAEAVGASATRRVRRLKGRATCLFVVQLRVLRGVVPLVVGRLR